MKLTTTAQWPHEGWTYRDPKTNYVEPSPMSNGFVEVAAGIARMRRNNPHIYPDPMTRTQAAAEGVLEEYTTLRLARKGMWKQLVLEPGDEDTLIAKGVNVKKKHIRRSPGLAAPVPAIPAAVVVPVARGSVWSQAKKLGRGTQLLKEWTGNGEPVVLTLASHRATVCKRCPLNNQDPNWLDKVTKEVSQAVREQLELKHKLNLTTAHDGSLGVCDACLCPLKLKVWVPMEYIEKYTDEETFWSFHPDCWILAERV